MTEYIMRKHLINRSKVDWTDFNCNHYRGCAHNCQYPCYARKISHAKQSEWTNVRVVKNALELAVKEIRHVPRCSTIMVSSMTDPYQLIERTEKLTRSLIPILAGYETYPVLPNVRYCFPHEVIIITKSNLVTRDFDLIKLFPNISLCMTITSIEPLPKLEPYAPDNIMRIKCLRQAHMQGIRTIASIEPWIPHKTKIIPLINLLASFVDTFFIGSWNHKTRQGSVEDQKLNRFYRAMLPEVEKFLTDRMKKLVVKSELQRRVII